MKEIYKALFQEYKENEKRNSHAENYCLLANTFGSPLEKRIAKMNLQRRNRLGYACPRLSKLAHLMINDYYYELKILANDEKRFEYALNFVNKRKAII